MGEFLQILLPVLIAVIGSSGIWGYLDHRRSAKESKEKKETEEEKAARTAIKALVRIELVRESLHYIDVGSITVEEADALTDLYDPYVTLGGNGNGKRLYEQALALPRRTGRNAKRSKAEEED